MLWEKNNPKRGEGVVANLARAPKGGDTDQLLAVAAGECDIAISNTYYFARLLRSEKPEDKKVVQTLGVIMPNQNNRGTHVNVSGGGMLKYAPNKEAAVRYLEYLASDAAQLYFADGNNEWPVVRSVNSNNPALKTLGTSRPCHQHCGNRQKPTDCPNDLRPRRVTKNRPHQYADTSPIKYGGLFFLQAIRRDQFRCACVQCDATV